MTTFYIYSGDAGEPLYIYKGPDDRHQVVLDWSDWLGSSTISSVEWEIDSGPTLSNSSNTTTTATNYVNGGVAGSNYDVRCTITTGDSPALIETRTVEARVVKKR